MFKTFVQFYGTFFIFFTIRFITSPILIILISSSQSMYLSKNIYSVMFSFEDPYHRAQMKTRYNSLECAVKKLLPLGSVSLGHGYNKMENTKSHHREGRQS